MPPLHGGTQQTTQCSLSLGSRSQGALQSRNAKAGRKELVLMRRNRLYSFGPRPHNGATLYDLRVTGARTGLSDGRSL